DFDCIIFRGTDQFRIEDAFLQVAYYNFMKVDPECVEEVLHEVVSQRTAGMHLFQRNRNGLRFESADDDGQSSESVHFSQHDRIRMRLRDAMGESHYFQFYFLHKISHETKAFFRKFSSMRGVFNYLTALNL